MLSPISRFYYHPRMLAYEISPTHPLKPERLRRTVQLIESFGTEPLDPGIGLVDDIFRVHDPDYVAAIRELDPANPSVDTDIDRLNRFGLGRGDNPAFPKMYEASLAYVGGTARAARDIVDGANLAFGISGGLHHALASKASGFCIFNDPAIACHILRERFSRVAYVDIDVHHGDGVQWLFYDDPSVLTCSIHEEGRSLWPGTGWMEETGKGYSSVNVPVAAKTSGTVWLDAFERDILPAIERFEPEAIVLQLGADSHFDDPLAHVSNTVRHWLAAVARVRDLNVPIVATGGGGYALRNVPRMWTAACLTLAGAEVPDRLPASLAEEWGVVSFLDEFEPADSEAGKEYVDHVLDWLSVHVHPNVGR